MDDKHVQDILRKSWSPEPPDGMRERVLQRSREELARRRLWFFPRLSWKLALACIGVFLVLMTNAADNKRQAKLSAMVECSPVPNCTLVAERPITLGQWRKDMDKLLDLDAGGTVDRVR